MTNATIPSVRPITIPGLQLSTIEDTAGADAPDNSELRKIAEDVLDAAKYTLAAVAANPDQNVRSDSLEAAFKGAISRLDATKRARMQQQAKTLVEAPEDVRTTHFGRYGKFGSSDLLGLGFARADEALPPLALDKKLLGIKEPTISLPVSALRRTPEGGVLVPADQVPSEFEAVESLDTLSADFEEAQTAAMRSDVYDASRLNQLWGFTEPVDGASADTTDTDEFEAAVTDKLGFYITQVKCVDETNPEWLGSDEIAIAGVTVDETGDTKKVGETFVGGGFDDGDVKNYAPHWRFTWFNLREAHGEAGSKWPKMYFVTLLLAEKDHGGFSSSLDTVWKKIGDEVKKKVAAAITGALSGLVGPAIAAAIGQIAAWIVNALVGWIIKLFKDDLFPPRVIKCKIPSFNATWSGGSKTSSVRTASFSGHGGQYTVRYYWKLFA